MRHWPAISRAVASTRSTARQVSAGLPASVMDTAPSSRTTRIRRSPIILAVVSMDAVNIPTMVPSDSRIGLCENVKKHFSFGSGIHFCLGAPLARLIGTRAYEALFTRLGDIRLAEGRNDFTHLASTFNRAPNAVHIEFDPA